MPEGLLLPTSADRVEHGHPETDHVEDVGDHGHAGQLLGRGAERRERITRHHVDPAGVIGQQTPRHEGVAALGDLDDQPRVQVHECGHVPACPGAGAASHHHDLVDPDPAGVGKRHGVGFGEHGAHHRGPAHAVGPADTIDRDVVGDVGHRGAAGGVRSNRPRLDRAGTFDEGAATGLAHQHPLVLPGHPTGTAGNGQMASPVDGAVVNLVGVDHPRSSGSPADHAAAPRPPRALVPSTTIRASSNENSGRASSTSADRHSGIGPGMRTALNSMA